VGEGGSLPQARAQDPDEAEVYALLGYVARAEGKLAEAEDRWKHTLRLEPEHADAQLRLARLAYDRHEPDAALEGLERYLKLARYPAAEAHYLVGVIDLEKGDLGTAEESLRQARPGSRVGPGAARPPASPPVTGDLA
jgi:tetratricopeptide (TPR) repeat protein